MLIKLILDMVFTHIFEVDWLYFKNGYNANIQRLIHIEKSL